MPTYEYECRECAYRFEELQSINDKPLKKCPQCGKLKLSRLISAGAGIIFKGSGFYVTDNKSKSGGGASGKTEKKEPATASTTDTSGGTTESAGKATEKKKKETA